MIHQLLLLMLIILMSYRRVIIFTYGGQEKEVGNGGHMQNHLTILHGKGFPPTKNPK